MRILIVSQYFWPEQFLINEIALSLKNEGHQVEVLTGLPNYPGGQFFQGYSLLGPYKEIWNDIPIYRAPMLARGNSRAVGLSLNYLSFAVGGWFRAFTICTRRYDVSFVFGGSPVTSALPAIFFKIFKRVPMAIWVLDLWPESVSATGFVKSKPLLYVIGQISKFIYRQARKILVASEAFIEPMKKFGIGSQDISFFPNTVDRSFEHPNLILPVALAQQLPKKPEGGIRLIFAGNIGIAQDFPTILRAFTELKELGYEDKIQFVVLGDGSQKKEIEAEVMERRLTSMIHFLGKFPVETMPGFYHTADGLLVTLKKHPIFAMTVPCKMQSYMACSKPIITAIDGEGARLVRDAHCGFAGPAEDHVALRDNILALLKLPPTERDILGKNSYEYFDKYYRIDKILADLNQTFRLMTKLKING